MHHHPDRNAAGKVKTRCPKTLNIGGPDPADEEHVLNMLKWWCVAPYTLRDDKDMSIRLRHKKINPRELDEATPEDLLTARRHLPPAD